MSFASLYRDVIAKGLCARCGICAGVCPVRAISVGGGNFPELTGDCTDCGLCGKSCPGAEADFPQLTRRVFGREYDPADLKGCLQDTFVAHASRENLRATGTSGGMVTALLIHLLESGKIDGAVVAAPAPGDPCRMRGVLATTPGEIMAAAKSKYCLTASMEALAEIRKRKGLFAVVGLPCQVQGIRKLMDCDSSLRNKIYCVFGLYCHCNMEPRVQYDILRSLGIGAEDVARFDFRGGGWPGGFHVVDKAGQGVPLHATRYTTILNVLFKIYGAERCYLCIDAVSCFADLSFGDFWAHDYREDLRRHERCTMISQRTPIGLEILREAEQQGAITLYDLPPDRYAKRILNMTRGKVNRGLARIARLKGRGEPAPGYGFPLPTPGGKARRSDMMLRFAFLFRGPLARKLLLKLLFSGAMKYYERVNLWRKRKFCNFHEN